MTRLCDHIRCRQMGCDHDCPSWTREPPKRVSLDGVKYAVVIIIMIAGVYWLGVGF